MRKFRRYKKREDKKSAKRKYVRVKQVEVNIKIRHCPAISGHKKVRELEAMKGNKRKALSHPDSRPLNLVIKKNPCISPQSNPPKKLQFYAIPSHHCFLDANKTSTINKEYLCTSRRFHPTEIHQLK